MKWKYFFLACFLIGLYGFLPVSFPWKKPDFSNPNHLLIHHQECGCPCADASIKKGELLVPDEIRRKYQGLYLKEINLAGRNPFDPYEFELAHKDIYIEGKVVGVDTIACDPSGCEIVPVFEVNSWSTDSYYQRFWTHGKWFLIVFLLSCLVTIFYAGILLFGFMWKKIKNR